MTLPDDTASVLLDDTRPEYLGGQFVAAVVSSLDYATLADFFRTGRTVPERPPRFHRAIEAVTVQDIAVFFQEGLAQLPELAASLAAGGRILDVACGGGKWLIAVAQRFPATSLVGVEFEPDSVARAMRHVTDAGLESRIRIEARDTVAMPFDGEFDLVYLQDALHELADPAASLRSAWKAVRPGGRLVVLDWCLPSSLEDSQSLQAELLWGVQIDELFQGVQMYTREGFLGIFGAAGVPRPTIIELRVRGDALRGRAPRLTARRPPGSGYSVISIVKSFIWVGWTLQWYVYVPASLKTRSPVAPLSMLSVPHEPSSSVAVCGASSPFVQPITSPTLAVTGSGE